MYIYVFLLVFQIKRFEKLETDEERIKTGKEIYDQFIMKELLSQSHVSIANVCYPLPHLSVYVWSQLNNYMFAWSFKG